jgi:hypothetical protein
VEYYRRADASACVAATEKTTRTRCERSGTHYFRCKRRIKEIGRELGFV